MLEKEIKLYEKNLPSYLKERFGQYVLIKGDEVSFFKGARAERKALEQGLLRYGVDSPFLVRRILERQPKVEMPAYSLGLLNLS